MLRETEETIGFFVTFLSLVAFQLGEGDVPIGFPPGYAYVHHHYQRLPPLLSNLFPKTNQVFQKSTPLSSTANNLTSYTPF